MTTVRQLSASDYPQLLTQNVYDSPEYQKPAQTGLSGYSLVEKVDPENKKKALRDQRRLYLSPSTQEDDDSESVEEEEEQPSSVSLAESRQLLFLNATVPEKIALPELKKEKLADSVKDRSIFEEKVDVSGPVEQQRDKGVSTNSGLATAIEQNAPTSTSFSSLQESTVGSSSTFSLPPEEQSIILPNEAFDFIHSFDIEGRVYNRGISALAQILNSEVKRNIPAEGSMAIPSEQMDQILNMYSPVITQTLWTIYLHRNYLFNKTPNNGIPIPFSDSGSSNGHVFGHTATFGFNEMIHAAVLLTYRA